LYKMRVPAGKEPFVWRKRAGRRNRKARLAARVMSALLFGLAASSALVIGGVIGAYWRPPHRLVAVALAFASGALITALATDLFVEPFRSGGVLLAGIGLLAGAAAFVVTDALLDRYIESQGAVFRASLSSPR
jgi:zinc transporter, ZIP family